MKPLISWSMKAYFLSGDSFGLWEWFGWCGESTALVAQNEVTFLPHCPYKPWWSSELHWEPYTYSYSSSYRHIRELSKLTLPLYGRKTRPRVLKLITKALWNVMNYVGIEFFDIRQSLDMSALATTILWDLILPLVMWEGHYYYYPYFTEKKSEAHMNGVIHFRSHTYNVQRLEFRWLDLRDQTLNHCNRFIYSWFSK